VDAANADAKVGYLEFSGQGLGALEKALDHKEKLMAILGSRLLEGQPARPKPPTAVRLRQSASTRRSRRLRCRCRTR